VLQGDKVVSRKRGFTVTACTSAVPAAEETPEFNSLPTGGRVFAAGKALCVKRETQDLEEACESACSGACEKQMDAYNRKLASTTGFPLSDAQKEKFTKSASRRCSYACSKQGKSSTFVVPSRNLIR